MNQDYIEKQLLECIGDCQKRIKSEQIKVDNLHARTLKIMMWMIVAAFVILIIAIVIIK